MTAPGDGTGPRSHPATSEPGSGPTGGRVVATVRDGIGEVCFDNVPKHNAMNMEMIRSVPGVLAELGADDDVRVIVVRGAGEAAFISGADISEFADVRTDATARREYDRCSGLMWQAWATVEKPVLAMIHGFCLGGGMMTALHADLRLASDRASFGVPAARIGLGYSYEGVRRLLHAVGPARTAEILFAGRRWSATEAHAAGLLNRVLPAAELAPSTEALARQIADNAPLTVRAAKIGIREALRDREERDMAAVEEAIAACFTSADYREGQLAFKEKRPPRFTGR